jgi:hypothetical protein
MTNEIMISPMATSLLPVDILNGPGGAFFG